MDAVNKKPSAADKLAMSAVFSKVSNLQTQEPDLFLGIAGQIGKIKQKMQEMMNGNEVVDRDELYELEEVIDELLISADQIRNRVAFIQYLSAFVDFPNQVFFILAVVDLIRLYKFGNMLLKAYKFPVRTPVPKFPTKMWAPDWQWRFPKIDLNLGNTIISSIISKFTELAFQKQLSCSLRNQVRWLRDEFTSLQDSLKDVDSKGLSEEGIVWVEQLCDLCRSAENVIGSAEYRLQLRQMKKGSSPFKHLVWGPQNFISQYKVAQQMARLKGKILSGKYREIPRHIFCDSLGTSGSSPQPSRRVPVEKLDIASFDEEIDSILAKLLQDDSGCITISIVGVAGTGKTSLAKLIYENKAIVDHFPHRIWVSGATVENIRKLILGVEGLDPWDPTYQDKVRQNAIFVDKKYFIVVDDACSAAFPCIRATRAFKDISNGTRMIFTRRDEVLPMDDTKFTCRLHLRTDKESWALFTHALKIKIPSEMEENLKNDILKKCGGLPEVIVKMGELLSKTNATLDEWSKVLEQLIEDKEPWSQVLKEINENKYFNSYQRRCLFHLGLFPAGYKIPARRLIALWVAEGLSGGKYDKRSPECIAELCLRGFVNSNMVQVIENNCNDKIKTCRLPEALRLHWFSKAKEMNTMLGMTPYLTDHLDQNDAIFDHIHGSNTTPIPSCGRDVISFLSFDTREESKAGEDIHNFLDRSISSNCFGFLWVLDLERVYKPKLPKIVDQLTQLRYLGLRWTYLDVLPMFIAKLLNLQTLDLKGTCIKTLPSSIWIMQKLRHLFLDDKSRSPFVPRQDDSSLMDLQTLRGVYVDEESPVRNGLDTLSKITKLGLKCRIHVPSQKAAMSSQLITVANWVKSLKHLQYLNLKSFDENGQPWDLNLDSLSAHLDLSNIYLVGKLRNQHLMSELPNNLIELTLSASGLADDPMQKLAMLPNLRILRLFSRSFAGKKMLCSSGGFRKLEVLKFWELELLEEWNVEEASLPCLTELEIRRCRNLKMIPDGLQNIRTLREVILTGVPTLSSRVKENLGQDWNKIAHVRHVYAADNDEHNKSN